MTMSDFAVYAILSWIFMAGFICGTLAFYFIKNNNILTKDKMKKLIAKEPHLTKNMIYKKYKAQYPTLTKRFIRGLI
jgi:uncharacterized membrane protein YciS (DUF1049 family)